MRYSYTDHLPAGHTARTLRSDVLEGLSAEPRWLPPKWFYDKTGSALFEEITRLPEYYPTRTERELLRTDAAGIVARSGARVLVELGSGSSEKTRLLLDALPDGDTAYVALDVSESALRQAGEAVAAEYPAMRVAMVRADFESQLQTVLSGDDASGGRIVAFLGGTIGNLAPGPRGEFLARLRAGLVPGDSLLLGADLVKSPEVLIPAYDDSQGVTAAFNLNVLEVLNRRLAADFDPADFRHRAVWDEAESWIEMRLQARRALRVTIAELGLELELAEGEEIRTEISAKFTRERLEAELAEAGFDPAGWWTDEENLFSLSLWTPTAG